MPATGDLNSYNTQGLYKYTNGAYTNSPVSDTTSGLLEVFVIGTSTFIVQRMTVLYASSPYIEVYQRRYRKNTMTWSIWYKETLTVVS